MRPNQQNRRMRGRGNRKGPNPLTRSYESNGPDVKIRGSAQQIADKYTTLARDAQAAGDRVIAENYLQHAEHYNRIIAAAMTQLGQSPVRDLRDDEDEDDDERDDFDGRVEGEGQRQWRENADAGAGPQPVIEGVPAEVAMSDDGAAQGESRNGNTPGRPPREGDENFRRNRRNRRSRNGDRPAMQGQGESEGGDADEGEATSGLMATLSRTESRRDEPAPAGDD